MTEVLPEALNPIQAAAAIRKNYVSYLQSSFAPRDPSQRNELEALLENSKLSAGPFLQAQAPYSTGKTIRELVQEGVLHDLFTRHDDYDLLDLDRPLYVHQENTIRKALSGRNLIVATGTGSGKTESFLLPILNSIFREFETGTVSKPGVRALLLYPMNALANDQLSRLQELLEPYPEITFGRYTGDTLDKRSAAVEQYRMRFGDREPLSNELIDRQTMKETPPHLLITNFAMLEYLLLRPDEQFFFDGPTGQHWSHIVLDEIHVYDGAKGAEIGMLLRRVRDRVIESNRGQLRCVGTSATLGAGKEDHSEVIKFAEQIFDEPFDEADVIEAVRDSVSSTEPIWTAAEGTFQAVRNALRDGAPLSVAASIFQVASYMEPTEDEALNDWLGRVLAGESHVQDLQRLLEKSSIDIDQIAPRLFDSHDKEHELVALVELCVKADNGEGRPLLPARWHFMLRAVEGAFTCFHPNHPAGVPRMTLERHKKCPACAEFDHESTLFEAAACTRCGAQHIVGEIQKATQRLIPPRAVFDNARTYLVDPSMEPDDEEIDEDDLASADEDFEPDDGLSLKGVVCYTCGDKGIGKTGCECGTTPISLQEYQTPPDKPVRRCLACGSQSSGAPIIQRFLTGHDAPVASIATTLYQTLPGDESSTEIGMGRKLLSFADSRQDAAYFASFLDRVYSRAVHRRLIWSVLAGYAKDGDLTVPQSAVVQRLARRAKDGLIIPPDTHDAEAKDIVRSWVYREFVGLDTRQSLEGVGLAEVLIPIPQGLQAPEVLRNLGLTDDESFDLIRVLLNTVRRRRAVTLADGVTEDDPAFDGIPFVFIRSDGSDQGILSWNPSRGSNNRVRYVEKVLEALRLSPDDARNVVRSIWNWLMSDSVRDHFFTSSPIPRGRGTGQRLDSEKFEFMSIDDSHLPYRCTTCRQIWWRTVRDLCPGTKCDGTVEQFDTREESDYFRDHYQSIKPVGMICEEHTAQLDNEVAAERQLKFINGKINVLSCSTTFELGVDVGSIQSVLLRNVPPSPANYVQRAGRAGRRAGVPALIVTFAQRRSHDLQYFDRPSALIDGHVSAPVVNVANAAIVRRHIHAIALSEFERMHFNGTDRPHEKVSDFFLQAGSESSASEKFKAWLESHPVSIGGQVERVLPQNDRLLAEIDPARWKWVDDLFSDGESGGHGRFLLAEHMVRSDIALIEKTYKKAHRAEQNAYAARLQRILNTLKSERTIDRLARAGVLPRYGFPIDTVELQTDSPTIELSRDLSMAISEFSPESQIVADKQLWQAGGLQTHPKLALPRHSLYTCRDSACGRMWTTLAAGPKKASECPSCSAPSKNSLKLIQPIFGFIGQSVGRPGDQRPKLARPPRMFFDNYEGERPEATSIQLGSAQISLRQSKSGRIVLVNDRAGFYCPPCGYFQVENGDETGEVEHKRPKRWSKDRNSATCNNKRLQLLNLGHSYLTDIVDITIDSNHNYEREDLLSFMAALLSAVDSIGITQSDVNGTLLPEGNIVLFDAVPGGAGHAHRIAARIDDLVDAAHRLTAKCSCGIDSSCYGCLRSYRNQRHHDELTRERALNVLGILS